MFIFNPEIILNSFWVFYDTTVFISFFNSLLTLDGDITQTKEFPLLIVMVKQTLELVKSVHSEIIGILF